MIQEILYKLFKIDKEPCQSCEVLKMQIGIVNNEKSRLLEQILALTKPELVVPQAPVILESANKRAIPWNVQRQMLEAEDRKAAQVMAEQRQNELRGKIQENINKLETELGVNDAKAVAGRSEEAIHP